MASAHRKAEQPPTQPSTQRKWGILERLIPDDVTDDTTAATRHIVDILVRHYEQAARHVAGRRVLDIACGSGYGSRLLKNAGAGHVVGVDVSASAIEYAKVRYGETGIEFVAHCAESYESTERFDVAVSFETIEHLSDPGRFLHRLRSLIKPSGQLFLSLPLGETRNIDPYHCHIFTEAKILQLLDDAGFSIEASQCEDWTIRQADFRAWRKQHPEEQPTIRELLFTARGRGLLWQIVSGLGSLTIPQLIITARNSSVSAAGRTRRAA